jgi:hypothetical protein
MPPNLFSKLSQIVDTFRVKKRRNKLLACEFGAGAGGGVGGLRLEGRVRFGRNVKEGEGEGWCGTTGWLWRYSYAEKNFRNEWRDGRFERGFWDGISRVAWEMLKIGAPGFVWGTNGAVSGCGMDSSQGIV